MIKEKLKIGSVKASKKTLLKQSKNPDKSYKKNPGKRALT